MAYLSLYRKWRPQTFDDVVGQKHVVRTLVNALNDRRTAHAYLFCGPRGTGKTTVARLLAKGLNCEQGPTGDVCNECESCKRVAAGSAMDVIEIDGASNRGIDEVREIRERVHYAPTQGRFKVYIVDEVHMLTNEAFNALLKILEEPPAHAVFVFATTEAHKIPATIASRCQRFDFHRFRPSELVEQLRKVLTGEGVPFEEAALSLVARHAEGGMRDALAVLDQCIAYQPDGVTAQVVNDVLGTAPRERLVQFVRAHLAGSLAEVLELVRDLDEGSTDLRQFARDVIGYLRDLMVLRASGKAAESLLTLLDSEKEEAAELAERISLDQILGAIEVMGQVEANMRWAPSPVLALEIACVKLYEVLHESAGERGPEKAVEPTQGAERAGHTTTAPTASASGGGSDVPPWVDSPPEPRQGAEKREGASRASTSIGVSSRESGATEPPVRGDSRGISEERPATLGRRRAEGPRTPAQPERPAPSVDAQGGTEDLQTLWERLLGTLRTERLRQTEALLREGSPVRLAKGALLVSFPTNREFHYANMDRPEHRQAVERVLSRMLGQNTRLELHLGEVVSRPDPAVESQPPQKAEGDAAAVDADDLDEPTLRAALRLFGGKILEIRREEENAP